jgi:hypothetical protein
MNKDMESIASRYDAEERACAELLQGLQNAHTFVGRAIARVRLSMHRSELQHIAEDYEAAQLHNGSIVE